MAEYIFKGTNPISQTEQKKLKAKYPAYASANVCGKAQEGGVDRVACGTGAYITRNAAYLDVEEAELRDYDCIAFVDEFGELDGMELEGCIWGVRAMVHIAYDPDSKVVASCKNKDRTALITNEETGQVEKVTSTAPIVTFGKKQYIWLNQEECKNGQSKAMELVSMKIIDSYYPAQDPLCDDYAQLEDLRWVCYDAVTEFCTDEEKASIVSVVMTDEDNFETATPVFGKVAGTINESVVSTATEKEENRETVAPACGKEERTNVDPNGDGK